MIKRTTLLIFAAVALAAADPAIAKCKFQKNKKDKETGEIIRTTKWDRFKMMADGVPGAFFAGQSRGGANYLVLKFEEQKTREKRKGRPGSDFLSSFIRIDKDSRLLVLLADESIVELEAERVDNDLDTWGPPVDWDDYSMTNKVDYRSSTMAYYRLDDETLAQLVALGYTDLRVPTNHGDRDISKSKPAKEIQAVLGCIRGEQERTYR
jgi:hypothetical protein